MMVPKDRRATPRLRAYKGGKVIFGKRLCTYDCVVRDFSPRGARLKMVAPEFVPNSFFLNIPKDDVYNKVYPVWPYAYFALLIPVFLLTDFLRYKPVIIFEGLSYIATWSLLIWGHGVPQMQAMQFTYGIATSTEVAYYTYIYAKVDPKHFQKVTSFTR